MFALNGIWKRFGSADILRGASMAVGRAERLCLMGPSGAGKTMLLRIFAGLESPDRGQVVFDGEDVTNRPANLRSSNMMFQDLGLFDHLDVVDNIMYGLRRLSLSERDKLERVVELIQFAELGTLERRMPSALSGGQRQRVALARALARRPGLLLLDEPFSAQDQPRAERLGTRLQELARQQGTAVVMVTHDRQFAQGWADRILTVQDGLVQQHEMSEKILL